MKKLLNFLDYNRLEAGLCAVIVFLIVVFIWATYASIHQKYAFENYTVWKKLEHREDISYPEWKTAVRAGLIGHKDDTVIIPIITPVYGSK